MQKPRYMSSVIHSSLASVKRAFAQLAIPVLTAGMVTGCNDTISNSPQGGETSPIGKTAIEYSPYFGAVLTDQFGEYMAKRFLVTAQENTSEQTVVQITEGIVTSKIPKEHIFEIELKPGQDLDTQIAKAQTSSALKHVGREYFYETTGSDDSFPLDNSNQTDAWWSASISLQSAYNLLFENEVTLRDTTIAVIDTSFTTKSTELENRFVDERYHLNLGNSLGKIPGSKSNDVNPTRDMWGRVVDKIQGKDAYHGTAVSAIIAAENNRRIYNGVSFRSNLLPISYAYKDDISNAIGGLMFGRISEFQVCAALFYIESVRSQLDIFTVNMAFAGGNKSFCEDKLIQKLSQNIVLVASAGNDYSDVALYPASFPQVISVGGVQLNSNTHLEEILMIRQPDGRYLGSNYNSGVDIVAPANKINIDPGYLDGQVPPFDASYVGYPSWLRGKSGTSFSAPMVAGAAAFLKSINPDLTPDEVREILIETGDEVNWVGTSKIKRLNVRNAVEETLRRIDGTPRVYYDDDTHCLEKVLAKEEVPGEISGKLNYVISEGITVLRIGRRIFWYDGNLNEIEGIPGEVVPHIIGGGYFLSYMYVENNELVIKKDGANGKVTFEGTENVPPIYEISPIHKQGPIAAVINYQGEPRTASLFFRKYNVYDQQMDELIPILDLQIEKVYGQGTRPFSVYIDYLKNDGFLVRRDGMVSQYSDMCLSFCLDNDPCEISCKDRPIELTYADEEGLSFLEKGDDVHERNKYFIYNFKQDVPFDINHSVYIGKNVTATNGIIGFVKNQKMYYRTRDFGLDDREPFLIQYNLGKNVKAVLGRGIGLYSHFVFYGDDPDSDSITRIEHGVSANVCPTDQDSQ